VSYDLYIRPDTFDADAIRDWFMARPNYQAEDEQVTYANPETGLYFTFHIDDTAEPAEDHEGPGGPSVAFNMNYFRPHTFALEAEPEVAAFLARFPSSIDDPQHRDDGPYTRDGFLEGWNHGNRSTFTIMAKQGLPRPHAADPARIEAAWAWNYSRAQLQAEAGENLFVPKIVWLQPSADADPEPAITWTFGVATIIPESLITRVVLVRQQRPKLLKMFARNLDPEFEYKLLGVESGIRIAGIERGEIDGRPALFTPATGTLEMQALFSGVWSKPQFQLLQPDAIFGADLLAPNWPVTAGG
jgi:hypothetical protein